MKILIVDDSSTMRKVLMRSLHEAGFGGAEIAEAGDGVEGLAAMGAGLPDLILSDINMPNMNGIDFVKNLRTRSDTNSIPVVMVTTESAHAAILETMANGANGYVVKPFTPDQLKEVVTEVLG